MQKSDDFGYYLNRYLSLYLPGERGLAMNSIISYRDTFALLLDFLKNEKQIIPEKQKMSFLTRELIVEFASWLETARKCSVSTRNQRIAALRAFCKWLAYDNPEFLKLATEVANIRLKKAARPTVTYMTVDALQFLLSQPDSSTNEGLRDLVLLALIYDTGARVSEIINLKFYDIRFDAPPTVRLTGKGNKSRIVPLLPKTVECLRTYLDRWKIDLHSMQQRYVFINRSMERYTRAGIKYILDKYVDSARKADPSLLPMGVSVHSLRHSKAMHLLQAGVNIVYIRDILGHADLTTTERYARADTKIKREALAKAEIEMPIMPVVPLASEKVPDIPLTSVEVDMAAWLRKLAKPQ